MIFYVNVWTSQANPYLVKLSRSPANLAHIHQGLIEGLQALAEAIYKLPVFLNTIINLSNY